MRTGRWYPIFWDSDVGKERLTAMSRWSTAGAKGGTQLSELKHCWKKPEKCLAVVQKGGKSTPGATCRFASEGVLRPHETGPDLEEASKTKGGYRNEPGAAQSEGRAGQCWRGDTRGLAPDKPICVYDFKGKERMYRFPIPAHSGEGGGGKGNWLGRTADRWTSCVVAWVASVFQAFAGGVPAAEEESRSSSPRKEWKAGRLTQRWRKA